MKHLLKRLLASREKALILALIFAIVLQPFVPLAAFASETTVDETVVAEPEVAAASVGPSITAFDVSATSVNLGDTMAWSGSAVKGSMGITQYRAFVVGANGGAGSLWTPASNPDVASFNNPAVSVELNPHSFYNGAAAYTIRFEVQDANGIVTGVNKSITVNAAPAAGTVNVGNAGSSNGASVLAQTPPTIVEFLVSPTSINQGQTMSWIGNANKGSAAITRYRAYVVGSNGGAGSLWTTATDPNSASFINPAVDTANNPRSFFHATGTYEVKFEVEDANGQVATAQRTVDVMPALPAGGPVITSFVVSASSVAQGQNFSWSGSATRGASPITQSRATVVGSHNGAGAIWTPAADPNAVSFSDSSIPTATNINSFYHGLGSYILRYEVQDAAGNIATFDRPFDVVAPAFVQGAPIIQGFSVSPNPVTQGQNMVWTGTAVKGSAPIARYRSFIIGSNNGAGSAWTLAADPNAVSFTNVAVPTITNIASFFQGPGSYTARFEVQDTNGSSTVSDIGITVQAASNAGNGNGSNATSSTATGTFNLSTTTGSTSENGGTAVIGVTLSSAPLTNVTLAVSSSDVTEGIVSSANLTFLPSNWNVAQNVTVTGIDDAAVDGNIAYTVTIGPSTSADLHWNGISAQTISLVNFDNEAAAPSTGGSTSGGSSGAGSSGGGSSGGSGGSYSGPCFGYNCPAGSSASGSGTAVPNDVWILIDSQNNGGTAASTGPTSPALVCPSVNFITRFLKAGVDNDPNEVRKLQYFLNTYEKAGLAVNGDFGTSTEAAVKAFQTKYATDILAPWGVTEPTGIVYITTSEKINRIFCGDNPGYSGNESIKDILDGNVLNTPAPDNSGQFNGAIGQATSTPSSNIAGVFGAFTKRIFDSFRTLPLYQLLIILLTLLGTAFTLQGAFKKDIQSYDAYIAFMKGVSVLSVASVLNVLNTLSFMLSPVWVEQKAGLTLKWVLALDMMNAVAFIAICLSALVSLYGRIAKDKAPTAKQ